MRRAALLWLLVGAACDDGGGPAPDPCAAPATLTADRALDGTLDGALESPCGAGDFAVARFVPPAPGSWLFTAEGAEIALRSTCDSKAGQRGCGAGALVEVLDAEPVFVVLRGSGDFSLRAEPAPPPALASAQVYVNVDYETVGVVVEGEARGRPVVGVEITLLDTLGDPHPATPDGPVQLPLRGDAPYPAFAGFASGFAFEGAEIARARVAVLDEDGVVSETIEVAAEPAPAADARCDPLRAAGACPEGTLCTPSGCAAVPATCSGDWPTTPVGAVPFTTSGTTSAAPLLARGSCGGGAPTDVYAFTAPAADSYLFEVTSEGHPDPILYVRSTCGSADLAAELGCNDDAYVGDVEHSRVVVELAAGETAYAFVDGFVDEEAATGAYRLRIDGVTAPTIDDGAAFVNADAAAVGVRVEGVDPDEDLDYGWLWLIDSDETIIAVDGSEDPFPLGFNEVASAGGRFTATLSVGLLEIPPGFAELAFVGTWVTDAAGLESELVLIPVEPAPALSADAECDVLEGFGSCPAGRACARLGAADTPPTCAAPSEPCPAAWAVVDLGAAPGWRHASDGAPTRNHGELATCSGGGRDDVYRFTAPAAGSYRFAIESDDPSADTVLFARSHCAFSQPRYELACNDDDGESYLSAVELTLAAEQTVYLFVAGYSGAPPGPYRLVGRAL